MALAGYTVLQRRAINDAQATLRAERATAAELQGEVSSLRRFGQLEDTVTRSRTMLATALEGDVSWSVFLTDLSAQMPDDSWVTSLALAVKPGDTPIGEISLGTVSYQGFVGTFPGLAGWLSVMDELESQRFVYLSNGNRGGGESGSNVVSFSANAHVTEALLSGRCQTPEAPCP